MGIVTYDLTMSLDGYVAAANRMPTSRWALRERESCGFDTEEWHRARCVGPPDPRDRSNNLWSDPVSRKDKQWVSSSSTMP
jgi:hypothetical protein